MVDYELERAIAEQIGVEQTLTASRMNWNLTFQGFMIAGFALVATSTFAEPTRLILELVICFAAGVVALATLLGVLASERQRSALKQHWKDHVPTDSKFPKPFSDATGSSMGRWPPRIICWTLGVMWIVLALFIILGPTEAVPV